MASSAGAVRRITQVAGPVLVPALAYTTYTNRDALAQQLKHFLTGPGKWSRLFALFVILYNYKSLPFAWTFRVIGGMIQHFLVRRPHRHTPDKLFHPVISATHTALMEVDYNIHKSNSTYFADLDVSRTHLVAHLLARGCATAAHNHKTRLVLDPTSGEPARGKFGVMLGAVSCSFRREIRPLARYEMYSRVLAWDRKWMYIVTHFLEPGVARPGKPLKEGWEKKVYATAISKYVFKIGRLTVHPAVLIGASGLLPERPGGWVDTSSSSSSSLSGTQENSGVSTPAASVEANGSAETTEGTNGTAKPAGPVADSNATASNSSSNEGGAPEEWDWRRTEAELQRGLVYAKQFAALDGLHDEFKGSEAGVLGRFSLG